MKKLTISEMNRMSIDGYRSADKLPLTVVLDNVRSRHNIGAVFRTADAFRLEKIYLCGISCCPPDKELHKTALGAEETVDWTYRKDTLQAVRELQQNNYQVFAIEQAHDSCDLATAVQNLKQQLSANINHHIAVVFGHEVFGVQQEVVDASDNCIEIPQYGTKHSLNVSVTAGIVIYTLAQPMLYKLKNEM